MLNESEMSDALIQFLESKLPSKRSKLSLGVVDPNLGRQIAKQLEIAVTSSDEVLELLRGVRTH